MGVIDIYSKRQKRELRGVPVVYQYDHLPTTFLTQVVFILTDLFSDDGGEWRNRWFRSIHNVLARELRVTSTSRIVRTIRGMRVASFYRPPPTSMMPYTQPDSR